MSKAYQPSLIPDPNVLPALLKKTDDPRLEQLTERKELHVLKDILARLSQQAGHGNRILEAHHVLLLHLLGFYNPMMRSLRTFELASQNQHVQEVVGLEPILSGNFAIVKRIWDEFSGTAAFLMRSGSRWRAEWNLTEGWAHAAA